MPRPSEGRVIHVLWVLWYKVNLGKLDTSALVFLDMSIFIILALGALNFLSRQGLLQNNYLSI